MKKYIQGKVYDTDTAQLVGEWSNNLSLSDFSYCQEELYRKKTGEYFVFGEGGAASRHCSHAGNLTAWGSRIIPLSFDEAQEWAEEHLNTDEIAALFGIPEAGGLQQVGLWLSATTHAKLRQESSRTGKSIGTVIGELVERL